FFGSATISGDTIALGSLGATKMACPEPIMEQEKRYLEALGNATRFAIQGKTLSIWTKGSDKPLTCTRGGSLRRGEGRGARHFPTREPLPLLALPPAHRDVALDAGARAAWRLPTRLGRGAGPRLRARRRGAREGFLHV